MATSTGWTFAEIDQLTLWDVNELMEYWADHPPAHVILAARYLKQGPKRRKAKVSDAAEDIHEFKSALGFTGIAGPLPAIYRDN